MTINRQCGSCTLCCKLLPVDDGMRASDGRVIVDAGFHKLAGERCPHQRHGKGCAVYNTRTMPACCRLWNCRWLVNDDTAELARPDRSHYVIDIMPDFITINFHETGKQEHIPVVQVWVDPAYPDAHRDPALRAYLDRRGALDGQAAIVRYNDRDGFVLFPPSMSADHQWHEEHGSKVEKTHTFEEKLRALGDNKLSVTFAK